MAQDVIVRGVTYTGVEKLNLPISGGSALFRDTSDGDAAASDVLSGKKAYNANGGINGGMTNQGAVSGTILDKDTPFQIPQGYHNGSGSVEIAAEQKALLIPGNIRDSVTILGVTGNYTGGGGGPTSADALLIVKAPAGSTVTATKGGTTLVPTLWTTAADANLECALFVIGSTLFDAQNAWTVTATLGTDTASDTVIVDDNKEYDLAIYYHVPSAYQEVEFLQSTGTQYIITGIKPSEVLGGTFSFNKTADVNYAFLWGAGSNSSSVENALGFRISAGGSQRTGLYFGSISNNTFLTVSTATDYYVQFTCVSGSQTVNISGVTASSSYSGSPTSSYYITLFTFHYANTVKTAENCKAKLGHIEFFDANNSKILDMYPCYRKSDSVAGMWDKVSETFHTNSGTGSFAVGLDVN